MTFIEALQWMEGGGECTKSYSGNKDKYKIEDADLMFKSEDEDWKTTSILFKYHMRSEWIKLTPKKTIELHETLAKVGTKGYVLEWYTKGMLEDWNPGTYQLTGKTRTIEVPSED